MMASEEREADRPPRLRTAALAMLLGVLALFGLAAVAGWVRDVLSDPRVGGWSSIRVVALPLLIGIGAIAGLVWLKPWSRGGPVSPATRKANGLFALSGLVGLPGILALFFGTMRRDDPFAPFSNGAIAPVIAVAAILGWLLSMLLAWWWYFSADEHERQANDFAFLVGGVLFLTATPVWWVAARAGLLPPPNAMVLWLAASAVWAIGWFWRRYR
jgi:hypothetical protein